MSIEGPLLPLGSCERRVLACPVRRVFTCPLKCLSIPYMAVRREPKQVGMHSSIPTGHSTCPMALVREGVPA